MAYKPYAFEELWNPEPPDEQSYEPGHVGDLPDTARRYLEHAIDFKNRPASAVRLQMHGEIKLKRWFPFTAEQIIRWNRGMIWRATVRMRGIPIRGFDRLISGKGEMRWKIMGLFPLISASGPDITKSAAGRVQAEAVWLPSVLCRKDVSWKAPDPSHAVAGIPVEGESADVEFTVDKTGRLESIRMKRWGNPGDTPFAYTDFGAFIEKEGTFDGYTIPTQLRVGWHFGTDRFESEGEFLRCHIDHAKFR